MANSDYADVTEEYLDVEDANSLAHGTEYAFQNTVDGENPLYDNYERFVYAVISTGVPTNRKVAMKSSTILTPAGETLKHTPAPGEKLYLFSPFGKSSVSINPTS